MAHNVKIACLRTRLRGGSFQRLAPLPCGVPRPRLPGVIVNDNWGAYGSNARAFGIKCLTIFHCNRNPERRLVWADELLEAFSVPRFIGAAAVPCVLIAPALFCVSVQKLNTREAVY